MVIHLFQTIFLTSKREYATVNRNRSKAPCCMRLRPQIYGGIIWSLKDVQQGDSETHTFRYVTPVKGVVNRAHVFNQ